MGFVEDIPEVDELKLVPLTGGTGGPPLGVIMTSAF
jgi:hypothetical protein